MTAALELADQVSTRVRVNELVWGAGTESLVSLMVLRLIDVQGRKDFPTHPCCVMTSIHTFQSLGCAL